VTIVYYLIIVSRRRLSYQFKLSATSTRASLKFRTRLPDWRRPSVNDPTLLLHRQTPASGKTFTSHFMQFCVRLYRNHIIVSLFCVYFYLIYVILFATMWCWIKLYISLCAFVRCTYIFIFRFGSGKFTVHQNQLTRNLAIANKSCSASYNSPLRVMKRPGPTLTIIF